MKNKLNCLIIIFLLTVFIPAFAVSDIEVQPAMISRSNAQDRVWVGTFQIVWNDFMDKFVRTYIRFREGTPASVNELNLKTFTASDISGKCYYKYAGSIKKNTPKNIAKAIKKKFNETSDILDKLDLIPSPNRYLIYAMLKKDFEFSNEFDKLQKSSFGQNQKAEYFGINNHTEKEVKNGVMVLFYNNSDDYAVVLTTKDNDDVYLYKNASNKPFKTLYEEMNLKGSKYSGNTKLGAEDDLKVPNIKFDVTKTFDEITGKRIMGTNFVIGQAIETVKFNMDNKGAQLKSEAAMTFATTALNQEKEQPRHFYFDNTFVIFLKEKGKRNPYFALRVNDITKFQ